MFASYLSCYIVICENEIEAVEDEIYFSEYCGVVDACRQH